MFERYPPKKCNKGDGDEESREDEDDARDGEDGGVKYEDVAHLQPSDGEEAKQEAVAYDDKGAATDTTGSSKSVGALDLPDDE